LVRRLISVALLTLVVTGFAWVGLSAGMFAGFQRRATDALFPSAPSDPRVVVVGIDGASIAKYGYPFPRDLYVDLVSALNDYGAKVVAFDVTFSSEREDQVAADARFAAEIDSVGTVVLGTQAELKSGKPAPRAVSLGGYAKGLQGASFRPGHVQVNADPNDAINRSVPLIAELPDGQFLPALSLAALMEYRGINSPVTVRPDGVQVGDRFIPTDANHSMLLNFSSRLSDPSRVISVSDVLAGTVPASKLAGKIVFVGAVDPALGDNRLAPINKATGVPGVLLHANSVNTMLTGAYLDPVGQTSTLLWVAFLTAVVGLAVVMLPFWLSPVVALLIAIGYFLLSVIRFNNGHVQNLVYPLVAIVFAFLGAVILRYFGETRQRRRVTALFSQYVPETVAKKLVEAHGGRIEVRNRNGRGAEAVLYLPLQQS